MRCYLIFLVIVICAVIPGFTQNNFVVIPGGQFKPLEQWDIPDEEKKVYDVNRFWLTKYEVTNSEYTQFLNSQKPDGLLMELFCCGTLPPGIVFDESSGIYSCSPKQENYPVNNVSWFGAKAYCKWKGGRLPSDVEWFYAAAEGKNYFPYMYSGSNRASDVAVYNTRGPTEIGTKNPNSLGLYDMSGNVSEWMETGKDSCMICEFRSFVDKDLRVCSNGNWKSLQDIFLYLRTLGMFRPSDACNNTVGFRIARD